MADTMLELLNEVVKLSTQLHAETDAFPDHTNQSERSTNDIEIPRLDFALPIPSNIRELFAASGATKALVEELTMIHCDRASDLATAYTKLYNQACLDMFHTSSHTTSRTLHRMAKRLQDLFRTTEEGWRQEKMNTIEALPQKSRKQSKSLSKSQPPFNQEFLPFLDAFYSKECRPSRADKVFLAQTSGMSYRQIDVWFQNRRRRAKEQAFKIADPNVGVRASTPVQASRESTPQEYEATEVESDSISDAGTTKSFCSRSSSLTLVDEHTDSFSNSPPLGAFPERYPPPLEAYPFPCQSGDFSMPKPEWIRKPGNQVIKPKCFVEQDLAAVIESFGRLNLKDEPPKPGDSPETRRLAYQARCDVMKPFTVRPLPAPLPFLICRPQRCTSLLTSARNASPRRRARRPKHCISRPCEQTCGSTTSARWTAHDRRRSMKRHAEPTPAMLHHTLQAASVTDQAEMRSETSLQWHRDAMSGLNVAPTSPSGEHNAILLRPPPVESSEAPFPNEMELQAAPVPLIPEQWALGFDLDFAFLDIPNFTDLLSSCLQQPARDNLSLGISESELSANVPIDSYPNHLLSF